MSGRPNIVIVVADHWRGDVLGHMGNAAAVTPNLDRLVASDAVSFRNAFCQSTSSTPSRCSFMTGWYPHVLGHPAVSHSLSREECGATLLKLLKSTGYFVWWGGKNDLLAGKPGLAEYCDVNFVPNDVPAMPGRFDIKGKWRGRPGSDTYYSLFAGRLPNSEGRAYFHDTDWANVIGAVEFLHSYRGQAPLCLCLSLSNPHPPYAVDEPWFSMIDRKKLPPRIPTPHEWKMKPAILPGIWERQNLMDWTEEHWNELRAVYYGMCARVDHQFGVVIEALEDAGLYDDTAIFMVSDHGDFAGDYGLVDSTDNTFEDCLVRVPLVVRPPASWNTEGRISNALVELVDLPATVCDMADLEPASANFGRSLARLLGDEDVKEHRDAVFCEGGRLQGKRQAVNLDEVDGQSPEGLYWPRVGLQSRDDCPYHGKATMCRTARTKYVRRLYDCDELYNLEEDPGELQNLAQERRHARTLAKLKDTMLTWYQSTCDVVPLDTVEPSQEA